MKVSSVNIFEHFFDEYHIDFSIKLVLEIEIYMILINCSITVQFCMCVEYQNHVEECYMKH